MTRSSRVRSGSRPTSLPPTKAELDRREKARELKNQPPMTPEERSVLGRQLLQLLELMRGGASKSEMAAARKRWKEERDLLEEDAPPTEGT